jgi:HEAT repeat protein
MRVKEMNLMKVSQLTFAAEELGEEAPEEIAVPALLPLLEHKSPVVREGAIYGLAHHLSNEKVKTKLDELAQKDTSPGVREAASDVLNT